MIIRDKFIIGAVLLGTIITPAAIVFAQSNNTGDANKTVENTPIIREETKTIVETIPYTTTRVNDSAIEYGKTVTSTKGVSGEKTLTYKITYKDNVEQSRELVKTEVTKQPVNEVISVGTKIVWHCVDVTSYDRNPYNDNKCTSSTGEVRYLSDSQAEALDSSYRAGKSGAWYYNNK